MFDSLVGNGVNGKGVAGRGRVTSGVGLRVLSVPAWTKVASVTADGGASVGKRVNGTSSAATKAMDAAAARMVKVFMIDAIFCYAIFFYDCSEIVREMYLCGGKCFQ